MLGRSGTIKVELLDAAWAAGVLEGEGCFSLHYRGGKDSHPTFAIHCEMTDKDVIESLQKALGGVGNLNTRVPKGDRAKNRKISYILSIQKQKDVFDTLITVMPFLHTRRLEKAKEMFNLLESKIVS